MVCKIISVSGGKDSTALMLHMIDCHQPSETLRFVFCDTGNEHKLTYEYLQQLDEYIKKQGFRGIEYLRTNLSQRLVQKRQNLIDNPRNDWNPERLQKALDNLKPSFNPFLDLCLLKGRFPSSLTRFCTQELKLDPTKKLISEILAEGIDCFNVVGVRADESSARAKLPKTELFMSDEKTGAECWTERPILTWTAKDCFDLIAKHGLQSNPLYKMGFKRVGCMPCINCTKAELKEIANRFPAEIYRIESWEKQVSNSCKRGHSTFFYDQGGVSMEYGKKSIGAWESIPLIFLMVILPVVSPCMDYVNKRRN